MDELHKRAAELAGRDVEVEQTTDGQHIVIFMRFDKSPPPKAPTAQEALALFISWMEAHKQSEQGQTEDRLDKLEAEQIAKGEIQLP